MKFNIALSLLIVAATAVLAVLQGHRLTDLKDETVVLEKQATALGLPVENDGNSKSGAAAAGAGGTKSTRAGSAATPQPAAAADSELQAREFARELIAFAKRMKEIEKSGEEMTREDKAALFAFLNRFLSLDAEVIPFLMEEVRRYDGLEESDKRNIMMFAMMSMAQSAPEKALDLFINSGDLFGEGRQPHEMVAMALGGWAASDPKAALAWLDQNGKSLPDKIAEGARTHAIASAFAADPEFAVSLALKLEKDQVMALAGQIGALMKTPDDQFALLQRLQDDLGDLPKDPSAINEDLIESATNDQVLHGALLVGLGNTLSRQSFESATGFLETANLDPTASFIVAKGISERADSLQDPGEWLPWLHQNSPESARHETVAGVVKSWTRKDFRATAGWIGEQPAGPLRDSATYTFAETVAPHEPASAARWALSLPDTPERTELLQGIHSQWKNKDQDAAATFAQQNGLTEE